MFRKRTINTMISMLVVAATILSACAQATTQAPVVPTTAPATAPTTAPAVGKTSVGIVLPTKDEPRWIQDETRFKDALGKAGYDVQILFSQGDSAKEKANVESLDQPGHQSPDHLPAGRHCCCGCS